MFPLVVTKTRISIANIDHVYVTRDAPTHMDIGWGTYWATPKENCTSPKDITAKSVLAIIP